MAGVLICPVSRADTCVACTKSSSSKSRLSRLVGDDLGLGLATPTLRLQLAGMLIAQSLVQEFPSIRFRASKPVGDDPGSGLETQALVSQRVALELDERLRQFQQAGQLPSTQTCDLIIVDRSAAKNVQLHCARAAQHCLHAEETCWQLLRLACAACPLCEAGSRKSF